MSETTLPPQPGLFGLLNSNRDFTQADSWGKNQFNSSFPAALCCYMAYKEIEANYLHVEDGKLKVGNISIEKLFGRPPLDKSTYFAFETSFSAYDPYSRGNTPRTDLVIGVKENNVQTAALEVKLTAIPDSTTHDLSDDKYGAEIVIRPDTIYYLSAGIALLNHTLIKTHFKKYAVHLDDWTDEKEVLGKYSAIHAALDELVKNSQVQQKPNILQPIWKTVGKSPRLAKNCLDLFVWSTTGFLYFILDISKKTETTKVTRPMRTTVWTYYMLSEIASLGDTNFQEVIDHLSYNTKNDKAFAASGSVTHKYMKHANLTKPRILSSAIQEIVTGGGHLLLSPERRFDAVIANSSEIFPE